MICVGSKMLATVNIYIDKAYVRRVLELLVKDYEIIVMGQLLDKGMW